MKIRGLTAQWNCGFLPVSGNSPVHFAISGEMPVCERKLATFTRAFRPNSKTAKFKGERPCLPKMN